jgi:X-Pro dipeptidyl-peptidase
MSDPRSPGGDSGDGGVSIGDRTLSRRRLLASVGVSAVGVSAFAGCATLLDAAGSETPTAYDDVQVARERAWVETPVDTDEDGDPDRVFVNVVYPESAADDPVPVIATASPYRGEQTHSDATEEMYYERAVPPAANGSDDDTNSVDTASEANEASAASGAVGEAVSDRPGPSHALPDVGAAGTSHQLDRRYVPKGYAVAGISSLGTHRSTGCYTAAGPETITALKAVVDWFNGRATAYDAPEGGDTVTADWTTGTTGMIGASALGELANGVAATGVDGLEAIVPQAANVGQYALFRSNGTPISVTRDESEGIADLGTWVAAGNARREDCGHWTERVEAGQDRATGDYDDFWHERTFLTGAENVDAAVLATHAVDDPIVKPNNVADWYETLTAHDVPCRLWLHEGGHTSPHGETWGDLLDRWWAHWLKGEDTGVMDEQPVTVVRGGPSADSGTVDRYDDWPAPGTERARLRFAPGGATGSDLTTSDPGQATESFTDDPETTAQELVAAAESPHRLRYETGPLESSVHVSGRVVPSLSLSFDDPTAVSAALVEYHEGETDIVTRGWADPLNRPAFEEHDTTLSYRESLRESAPVEAGERVRVEFPLQATDHVFDAGSRIGVVLYGSDRAYTLHVPGNRDVTITLGESSVGLPIVGGESALASTIGGDSALANAVGGGDASDGV